MCTYYTILLNKVIKNFIANNKNNNVEHLFRGKTVI